MFAFKFDLTKYNCHIHNMVERTKLSLTIVELENWCFDNLGGTKDVDWLVTVVNYDTTDASVYNHYWCIRVYVSNETSANWFSLAHSHNF